MSDRLVYIGPLDRAAFGWIVVLPIAWIAPGLAGLAWARGTAAPVARRDRGHRPSATAVLARLPGHIAWVRP